MTSTPHRFAVGARIAAGEGTDTITGTVAAAPAPGMRRIRWDDGTSGDVDTRDIRPDTTPKESDQ